MKHVWENNNRLYITNGAFARMLLLDSDKAIDTTNPAMIQKIQKFGTKETSTTPEDWENE